MVRCKQKQGSSFYLSASICHANCWLCVVIIAYLREPFVSQEWLMWKWMSSLSGALCQRIRDFTCGWSLRSRTQLELRIHSLLEKSLIYLSLLLHWEQQFVSPVVQERLYTIALEESIQPTLKRGYFFTTFFLCPFLCNIRIIYAVFRSSLYHVMNIIFKSPD